MLQRPDLRLVLASGSASRRALLAAAGLRFEVRPAQIDECSLKRQALAEGLNAEATALRLADRKAAAVAELDPDGLVIGADQILVCDGVWFDKPADLGAARQQLLALRGRSHVLATAVTCHAGPERRWHYVATPQLAMRDFSDAFLDAYLAAEAGYVTGTVGGYRIEGPGIQLFAAIEGEHAAIIGLPLLALLAFLRGEDVLA
jgi:septum formation protein